MDLSKIYNEEDKISDIYWFSENQNELLNEYGEKYFAIRCKQVIGIYESIEDAIDDLKSKDLLRNCSIQKCEKDSYGYTNGVLYVWY